MPEIAQIVRYPTNRRRARETSHSRTWRCSVRSWLRPSCIRIHAFT